MHLESKFTMSLVFATTCFFLFFFGGGGVLCHLVVQTDFEFKISGPLNHIMWLYITVMPPTDKNRLASSVDQHPTALL